MPDDIVIEDDEARKHLENLEALYKVALIEASILAREQARQGHEITNLGQKRIALRATIAGYDEKLVRFGDERFRLTGHHVMARWSREKIEQHN